MRWGHRLRTLTIVCVTLLAFAMYVVPMLASAQDMRAIHERLLHFRAMGKNAEALIHAQEFEAAVKVQRGAAHPDYGVALYVLGNAYYDLGRYEEAEVNYRHSLIILEKKKGERHPDLAMPLY